VQLRVIARMWRGRVRPGMIDEYRAYIACTGLADYHATAGNHGAWMFTRECEGYGEVITLSLWDREESIVAFAGRDVTRARYYPDDERFLLDFPERVDHYQVTQ
jgi:heme-degrading monooxygenase HmoA